MIVVVGSRSSSNSNRLREIATTRGIPGYLVDGAEDLRREWFEGKQAVGVTAGASAPESLVKKVVERLREWGGREAVEVVGREEHVVFGLPQALRRLAKSGIGGALTPYQQRRGAVCASRIRRETPAALVDGQHLSRPDPPGCRVAVATTRNSAAVATSTASV